jgi:hypothetical protein
MFAMSIMAITISTTLLLAVVIVALLTGNLNDCETGL